MLEKQKDSHWKYVESERIASPSDVGIHNTPTEKSLGFIDFVTQVKMT